MVIGVNTSPLSNGHKHRGSGTYIRLLLDALKKYKSSETYLEFTSVSTIQNSVDCIHFPFFDPFFLTLPATITKPLIVTVHDLIPLKYPKHFPIGVKGRLKWEIQKRRLLRAEKIITDSETSKVDIEEILHINPKRIAVIPLAPSPEFKPIADPIQQNAVKKKYKLPDDFLLYVGDVNWNKNIPNMLRAMKQISVPLVVVGKAFNNLEIHEVKEINRVIDEEQLHAKIIKLGFVESEDLPVIYTLAHATIAVSFAEGFGFPILESMACGTPCVSSNNSSLKEIAGPSVLVNPMEIQSIEHGINTILKTDKSSLSKQAITWAAKFSWQHVAEKTVEVYRSVKK